MKTVSTIALGLALAFGTAATPALAKKKDEAPAAKYSPEIAKGYNEAQKAVQAGDVAGATTQYQALKAAAKTDDDRNVVGRLAIGIGQKSNNEALMAEGIDMVLASGKAAPEEAASFALFQGKLAYQAKDFAKAEAALTKAQQAGSTDPDLVPLLVDVQARSGKRLAAVTLLEDAVSKKLAAGQPVPSEWYGRGLDIAYAAKPNDPDRAQLNAVATKLANQWLAAYPAKKNWRVALINYSIVYKIDDDQRADMWRLLRSAGAMAGQNDYNEYAELVYVKNPGEAKAVLDEGVAAGAVNLASDRNAGEIATTVKGRVTADRASLASTEKTAQSSASGKIALATGDGYLGYGDYAKAITLYKLALTKGGVDANTVNRRLGIAYYKAGQKDAAKQAFAAVTGPSQPLAQYWLTLIDHPATA